jgi:hypothetical protein
MGYRGRFEHCLQALNAGKESILGLLSIRHVLKSGTRAPISKHIEKGMSELE